MLTRYVDLERRCPPDTALATLRQVTADLGLRLEFCTIGGHWPGHISSQRATLRHRGGAILGVATGKGVGEQAVASGGYEAFEHAAVRGTLPTTTGDAEPSCGTQLEAVLPPAVFETRDRLYAYARHTRGDRPQPVLALTEITALPPPQAVESMPQDGRVLYPRAPVDPTLPAGPDLADLAPLTRYASSSGYAAGTYPADAILHAVNELVERDAVSSYLLHAVTTPRPLTAIHLEPADPLADLVGEIADHNDRPVHIVHLPSVTGTVVMAYQPPANTRLPSIGTGCSADPRIAVERALTELHQDLIANDLGATWASEGGVDAVHLTRHPRLHQAAHTPPPRTHHVLTYRRFIDTHTSPDGAQGGGVDAGIDLIPQLRRNGFPTLCRTVWSHSADSAGGGVHVVHVVVPGLERFDNILFGRPILPAGRLWRAARALLEGAHP